MRFGSSVGSVLHKDKKIKMVMALGWHRFNFFCSLNGINRPLQIIRPTFWKKKKFLTKKKSRQKIPTTGRKLFLSFLIGIDKRMCIVTQCFLQFFRFHFFYFNVNAHFFPFFLASANFSKKKILTVTDELIR